MTVVEMLNTSRICIGRPQVCYLLQTAHPAKSRRGRMSLALLDGVIGRQQSAIGTVPNKRKPGLSSVERATSAAPPRPAEHAMIEAAIQLDLITPEQAEALVEKGTTLSEWITEQSVEMNEPGKSKQKKMDRLWLLALLLFNLVMWAGLGWIVLRVLKSL
jgi:hypothetical protein